MPLILKELNFQEIEIRHSMVIYRYQSMTIFRGTIEFSRRYCFSGKNHCPNNCKFGVKSGRERGGRGTWSGLEVT